MRAGKEIDFAHVDFITYAIDEFYRDVPMLEIASNYVKMFKHDANSYIGEFEYNGETHKVVVHLDCNICTVDYEPKNPEEFIAIFEGDEMDAIPIIKKITGVDLDEYISDVTYSNGVVELLDVKGKTLLIGNYKRVLNGDKD